MDALHRSFLEHLAQTGPDPLALDIVGAEGCWLTDRDGKRYLDLVAGLAVNNTGHRHPQVVTAIKEQCDRYLHVIPYGEFVQEPQVRFAERLIGVLPAGLDQVYFVNSGTEAVEAALKLAKRVTGRPGLVACDKSYHGSTHGSLSVTGNETKKYRYRPLLPGVRFIGFNDPKDLDVIDTNTAAAIVEPIQGDAGVRLPDIGWMKALRDRCDRVGALLILDEVQTGFGRTGRLFAFEQFDVVPDILVLGKALGGGLPMGAFVAPRRHMELLSHDPVLGHITTFGGHPLACVAGLAALDVLLREDLVRNAERMGELFKGSLVHSKIREVRGEGLMLAVELGDAARVRHVVMDLLRHGVLGFWFLSCPTAFRIAPPLIITPEEVHKACAAILEALDRA
ncbi:MAG TPA: aspartate aminotransferase family protein [Flavobacteriales bacterium]|nr:aspartate aminotransferase family protein [Flavobacteriales bacterium]